jgi:hypothetical protein
MLLAYPSVFVYDRQKKTAMMKVMIFGALQRAGGRWEPAGRDKVYPLLELPATSRRACP